MEHTRIAGIAPVGLITIAFLGVASLLDTSFILAVGCRVTEANYDLAQPARREATINVKRFNTKPCRSR